MSDLQCPATFHVFGPTATPDPGPLVHGAPVAAVYAASGRLGDRPDAGPLDPGELAVTLLELSDVHRGLHVVVLADTVEPPLRTADDVVIVRVDADGWGVLRPGDTRD